MVYQMKVETCGAYIGTTNPYTGQALNHWLPRGNHWGKIYIHTDEEEEKEDDYDDCYGNDRKDYGMGWYDCNTDWRSWTRNSFNVLKIIDTLLFGLINWLSVF